MVSNDQNGKSNFSLYLLVGLMLSMTAMMLSLSIWFLDLGPSLDSLPPIEKAKTKMLALNPGFPTDGWQQEEGEDGMELVLQSPFVFNIEPLQGLSIQHLRLRGVRIKDLSPIRDVKNLWSIECTDNPLLQSIEPLSSVKGLERLILSGTSIRDLTPIAGLNLETIDLQNTMVSDLSALADMPLKVLRCSGTEVEDLTKLKGMETLEVVDVKQTQVRDLQPLMNCESLEYLDADEALLRAAEFLKRHPNRERIRLNSQSLEQFFQDA